MDRLPLQLEPVHLEHLVARPQLATPLGSAPLHHATDHDALALVADRRTLQNGLSTVTLFCSSPSRHRLTKGSFCLMILTTRVTSLALLAAVAPSFSAIASVCDGGNGSAASLDPAGSKSAAAGFAGSCGGEGSGGCVCCIGCEGGSVNGRVAVSANNTTVAFSPELINVKRADYLGLVAWKLWPVADPHLVNDLVREAVAEASTHSWVSASYFDPWSTFRPRTSPKEAQTIRLEDVHAPYS